MAWKLHDWKYHKNHNPVLVIHKECDLRIVYTGIIIIIIIMWLVQRRTLPFLRACSMPVDSALGDRRLLDQCWEVQGQTRRSEARCDAFFYIFEAHRTLKPQALRPNKAGFYNVKKSTHSTIGRGAWPTLFPPLATPLGCCCRKKWL